MNYTVYHLHSDLSNGVTNIDSVTKFTEYVDLDYQYSWDKKKKVGGLPFYPKQLMADEAEQEVFGA